MPSQAVPLVRLQVLRGPRRRSAVVAGTYAVQETLRATQVRIEEASKTKLAEAVARAAAEDRVGTARRACPCYALQTR